MTATRINPTVGAQLVSERYTTQITVNGSSDTRWEISASKSGYTPIMFSDISHGWSSSALIGHEHVTFGSGTFKIDGYGRKVVNTGTSVTPTIGVQVLWLKNQ